MKKRSFIDHEVATPYEHKLLLRFATPGQGRIKTRRDVEFDGKTVVLAQTGMYYITVARGRRVKDKP